MIQKSLLFVLTVSILLSGGVVLAQEEIINEEMMSIWNKAWDWLRGIFNDVWYKVSGILNQQVEQRRPEIEEEFLKELEEMKEDIPRVTKSLWQRLKELIR